MSVESQPVASKFSTMPQTAIDDAIDILIRQTTYTADEAREKLIEFDGDIIPIISQYMGIVPKSAPIKSKTQEHYDNVRRIFDIKSYRDSHPIELETVKYIFDGFEEKLANE